MQPSHRRERYDGGFTLWSGSLGLVLGLHGAIAAAAIAWGNVPPPVAPPPAALVLELAPLPAAPAVTPTEIPPGPEQVQAPPPPPPEPEPEPEPEQVEKPPPIEKAAVPLPPPRPRMKPPRKPPPRPVREMPPTPPPQPMPQPPASATTAPQAAPVRSTVAAAPVVGAPSPSTANALQTWQSLLLGHLERHKRYPRTAQWRRQEGVAYVRFTMDRGGNVLGCWLERSSGVKALDDETLALIQRAQPLPKPPPEIGGDTMKLVVPVQYFIR